MTNPVTMTMNIKLSTVDGTYELHATSCDYEHSLTVFDTMLDDVAVAYYATFSDMMEAAALFSSSETFRAEFMARGNIALAEYA